MHLIKINHLDCLFPEFLTFWMSLVIILRMGLKGIHQWMTKQMKLIVTLTEVLRRRFRCPDPPWHWY